MQVLEKSYFLSNKKERITQQVLIEYHATFGVSTTHESCKSFFKESVKAPITTVHQATLAEIMLNHLHDQQRLQK